MTTINYKGKSKLLLSMLISPEIRKHFPQRIMFKHTESNERKSDLYQTTVDNRKWQKYTRLRLIIGLPEAGYKVMNINVDLVFIV